MRDSLQSCLSKPNFQFHVRASRRDGQEKFVLISQFWVFFRSAGVFWLVSVDFAVNNANATYEYDIGSRLTILTNDFNDISNPNSIVFDYND